MGIYTNPLRPWPVRTSLHTLELRETVDSSWDLFLGPPTLPRTGEGGDCGAGQREEEATPRAFHCA